MLYYLESYTSWCSSSYGNNGCEGNCCHTIEYLTVVVSVKYCDLSPYIIRAPLYNCSQSWIAFLLWYACALMKHFFVELQGRENTLYALEKKHQTFIPAVSFSSILVFHVVWSFHVCPSHVLQQMALRPVKGFFK